MNLSECLDLTLSIIEGKDDEDPTRKFNHEAINKVRDKIFNGGSAIKKPLQSGNVSLNDIVKAIKNNRCLRTSDRDFGATYLEQIIGGAIRDVIPIKYLNQIRKLFGLEKLPPSELVKHKKAGIRTKQQPPSRE